MSGALNRETVRRYLLGRLDDQEELENKVSDDIFLNDASSEMIDSIEEEIIEDYAEGRLDSADRKSVEEYFLRSPGRREKLRFYKILRYHFETKEEQVTSREYVLPVRSADTRRFQVAGKAFPSWGARLLLFGQAAALLAFCILGWTYVSGVRQKQTGFESQLAQEKARSARMATQLSQLQPPIQILTLVSDRSRGAEQLPPLEIKPATQRIIVEIALTGSGPGSYSVRLESRQAREPIWTAKLLPLFSPSGDARLVFDLPAKGLQAGSYSLVVSSDSSVTGGGRYYDFEVHLVN